MSSNLKSPITGEYVRDTFGIKDPKTGKKYKDISVSFLQLRKLSLRDFETGILFENPTSIDSDRVFILHCDSVLRKKLQEEKEVPCMISFQRRIDGDFAIARIFNIHSQK